MSNNPDRESIAQEVEQSAFNSTSCTCGHMRCTHVGWGMDGPCGINDCPCEGFVERGSSTRRRTP